MPNDTEKGDVDDDVEKDDRDVDPPEFDPDYSDGENRKARREWRERWDPDY